jgi:hypothetical protein
MPPEMWQMVIEQLWHMDVDAFLQCFGGGTHFWFHSPDLLNRLCDETIVKSMQVSPSWAMFMLHLFRKSCPDSKLKGFLPLLLALLSEHPTAIRLELYRWKRWGRFNSRSVTGWSYIAEAVLRVKPRRARQLALCVKWPPRGAPRWTLMSGATNAGDVRLLIRRFGPHLATTRILERHIRDTSMFLALLDVWPGAVHVTSRARKFDVFTDEIERRELARRERVYIANPELYGLFIHRD